MLTWGKGQARPNFLVLFSPLCKKLPSDALLGQLGPDVTHCSIAPIIGIVLGFFFTSGFLELVQLQTLPLEDFYDIW